MFTGDLTGVWLANDGAAYYLRQLGETLWWAGFSTPTQFHLGIDFTNVFEGVIDRVTSTIRGQWVDVPRGVNALGGGLLALDIVKVQDQPPGAIAVGGGPGGGTDPGDSPPASHLELRKRPDETTGGFGADILRVPRFAPENRFSVDFAFAEVFRNDHFVLPNPTGGGTLRAKTMAQHLDLYKDNVVLFGDLMGGVDLGFGTSDRPDVPFTYANFMCAEGNWWFVDEDPPDGDLGFHMRVDRRRLDGDQPDFFTDEQWQPERDPNDIREKLDFRQQNHIHPEIIMFGRNAAKDNCQGTGASMLPGWGEMGPASVLINGRPINGRLEFGDDMSADEHGGLHRRVLRLAGQPIGDGMRVRITGALVLDKHGFLDPSGNDDPEDQNVEIHPVYAVDVVRSLHLPVPDQDLTAIWAASDVGTYYLRQSGRTVWWLGMSRNQGLTFTNVFHGTVQGNTIVGEWADVTRGRIRGSGNLTLQGDQELPGASTVLSRVDATGGFGAVRWERLYDFTGGIRPGPPVAHPPTRE